MSSTDWLLQNGFRQAGVWVSPRSLVHRADWLRHTPGVYAFVVDDVVHYIGKADVLHRRLRNYSRRSFALNPTKVLRQVHRGIAEEIRRGRTVKVYALTLTVDASKSASELERELIGQVCPLWNIYGKAGAGRAK